MSEEVKTEGIPTEVPSSEAPTSEEPSSEEPSSKKAKILGEGYTLNINNAVDKSYEIKSLTEIAEAPVAAIQGISDRGAEILAKYRVHSVADLAEWKFAKWCEAIVILADTEEPGKRDEASMMNINKAMDKEYEKKTLSEICQAPISAVQGLTDEACEFLHSLHVDTVEKLGKWKFYKWAKSIVILAGVENADFSSR
eukprot:CAMPEP_0113936078 /NCGR_PEP_ID=MMETSP1339-20121228/3061_1 /TAXON_ID=94617 /ORGANISM="Fibrocapsa japonica" /LENGTH=196 /DNA_ID=CAMNT_0000938417 /DNA_START=109 /DNA_END=699 /DNA_ORIENTATION=+ /assembly_acc=CAM_ASM_000762